MVTVPSDMTASVDPASPSYESPSKSLKFGSKLKKLKGKLLRKAVRPMHARLRETGGERRWLLVKTSWAVQ